MIIFIVIETVLNLKKTEADGSHPKSCFKEYKLIIFNFYIPTPKISSTLTLIIKYSHILATTTLHINLNICVQTALCSGWECSTNQTCITDVNKSNMTDEMKNQINQKRVNCTILATSKLAILRRGRYQRYSPSQQEHPMSPIQVIIIVTLALTSYDSAAYVPYVKV